MQKEIEDLQIRLAFQEDLIASLNERVAQQEQELSEVRKQLQHVNQKISSVASSMGEEPGDEAPPPHY